VWGRQNTPPSRAEGNDEWSYTSTPSLCLQSVHRNHAHILLDTVDYIHKPYYITVYQAACIEIFTSLLHICLSPVYLISVPLKRIRLPPNTAEAPLPHNMRTHVGLRYVRKWKTSSRYNSSWLLLSLNNLPQHFITKQEISAIFGIFLSVSFRSVKYAPAIAVWRNTVVYCQYLTKHINILCIKMHFANLLQETTLFVMHFEWLKMHQQKCSDISLSFLPQSHCYSLRLNSYTRGRVVNSSKHSQMLNSNTSTSLIPIPPKTDNTRKCGKCR
jgi:hypothetical protein